MLVLIPGWALCLFLFQAGFFAIYYEYPDGTVEAHKQAFQISPERFVNCQDMIDVARVLKEFCGGLEHLKELELRFCKGEQFELHLEDFLDEFSVSNRTSPVQIFCPAEVGPVPDDTLETTSR